MNRVGPAASAGQIPAYTHSHDSRLCAEKHDEVEALGILADWMASYPEIPAEVDVSSDVEMMMVRQIRAILAGSGTTRTQRHDGDCQMAQHTYVHQGDPGVYSHGPAPGYAADVVGANGRRLLVRDDPDGIYVGGALLTADIAAEMGEVLIRMASRRRARGDQ